MDIKIFIKKSFIYSSILIVFLGAMNYLHIISKTRQEYFIGSLITGIIGIFIVVYFTIKEKKEKLQISDKAIKKDALQIGSFSALNALNFMTCYISHRRKHYIAATCFQFCE